jgi:hypothetical protein
MMLQVERICIFTRAIFHLYYGGKGWFNKGTSKLPISDLLSLEWYWHFNQDQNFSSKIKGADKLQSLAQPSIPIPWREFCAWLKLKPECIALCRRWLERTNACLRGKHSGSASQWCHLPGKEYVRLTTAIKLVKLAGSSSKTRSYIQLVNSRYSRLPLQ